MPSESITCVGYCRVSTERQAGETLTSMSDQETAVRALAARLRHVDVGRWFRDAGASGATVEGRPAFLELLEWCEENRRPARAPGHVLVLNDSRFGRFEQPEESAYWRHHLYRLGWIVRFAEGDDVQGDFRTVVRAIGSVQASEFRRTLMANTRRGMKGAASQGFWTREAPYGFRRRVVFPAAAERTLELGQLKAPNEKVKLTPHEEEARIVRWVFETYAAGGESLGTLAAKLRARVPSRRWSRTVVVAMLRNDAYRGAVVGGRRRSGEADLYGCEGAHPALVTEALFAAAQARLAKNRELGKGVPAQYLVSGLLHCSVCGSPYTGGGGGRRLLGPTAAQRRFYKDTGSIEGVCPGSMGTVSRHLVDDAVVRVLSETLARPRIRNRIERAVDQAISAAPGAVGETEATLRAERARLEKNRARLVGAIEDGALLPSEASVRLEEIRAACADVDARIQALRFAKSRARGASSERDRLLELVTDLPALAARLKGAALREIIEPWIGSATFDKRTRVMGLGIRPLPLIPSLLPFTTRARAGRKQAGLIVRETSLLQRGHEHRVAEAALLAQGRRA